MSIQDRIKTIQQAIDELNKELADLRAEEKHFSEMSPEEKEAHFQNLQEWIDD